MTEVGMNPDTARRVAFSAVAVVVLMVAACGGGASGAASGASGAQGAVDVVASTNVWGDVAAAIGANRVRVTSIITDPSADPHSYEANARTRLAVSQADVVIENGGGYDDFMTRLVSFAAAKVTVINAVDVSGAAAAAQAAGRDLNEHVWYDFAAVGKVADRITAALAAADPGDATTFRANAATFQGHLQTLTAQETADRAATQGAGVAITEPVPLYLLDALGADNKTPPAFSKAVEEGNDVSPAVLQQTEELFTAHAVKALVYNAQTTDVQTELLKKAARDNNVAVVPVTETLPPGKSYVQWMTGNLDAISKALS
jgi:zinc/manganese transport system substrate-binding protein